MLVKFEQIVWSKLHEILSFFTKNWVFYNHFWQRVDAILEDVSVAEIIFFMFQKRHSDTCNQVRNWTKHDRSDQFQRKLTVPLK